MAVKKADSTVALVAVLKALEPLENEDRQWVLQSAASRWSVSLQSTPVIGGTQNANLTGSAQSGDVQAAISNKDPRAFIRIKKPATDVQRVACLGFFLVHTTGAQGFSSKGISETHTNSGGSKINLPRALDNATRHAKYLSNRGPREKQLTTLGEDIVEALPDQTAVKAVEDAAKGRRGKKSGAKKGKKA